MNYIHKLQRDLAYERERADSLERQIRDFIVFLHSPKFTGVQSDGSRKDWIATSDAVNWLREMPSAAVKTAEDVAACAVKPMPLQEAA